MENISASKNSDVINEQASDTFYQLRRSERVRKLNLLFAELAEDVREDLIGYLDRMGLAGESHILVIPSVRHYYYAEEDMKGVNTVVNLKQLNYVREIRDFLHNISELMPEDCSFVGCFIDNKAQNGFSYKYSNLPRQMSEKAEAYENGIESRIPLINRMYSFIDAKTNRYLTRSTVSHLLEENSLQLVSMTEMNGLTYFCTQKANPAA